MSDAPVTESTQAAATVSPIVPTPDKVVIWLRATGRAPLLKQSRFRITHQQPFAAVYTFVRRQLQLNENDPLFLYVNSAFAPAHDSVVGQLFKCYAVDQQLIVNYSITAAWG